jgi:hypothetical protein
MGEQRGLKKNKENLLSYINLPYFTIFNKKRNIIGNNPVCWFEIYVQDMARAKKFLRIRFPGQTGETE